MNQFYFCIMFLGIILVVVSFVWIVADRKKAFDYNARMDARKEELSGIISDAEQMIDELNRFSDYVVAQMELKSEELNASLRNIDGRIEQLRVKLGENSEIKPGQTEMIVNGDRIKSAYGKHEATQHNHNVELQAGEPAAAKAAVHTQAGRQQSRLKDNVIPLNARHKEVIRLSNEGLDATEIAKKLKMGKGEIQLILEMNR